jgi:pyruvate,water dikinase
MDIEWAKDGDNQLYIVQARPETVHGKDKKKCARFINLKKRYSYHGNRIRR